LYKQPLCCVIELGNLVNIKMFPICGSPFSLFGIKKEDKQKDRKKN